MYICNLEMWELSRIYIPNNDLGSNIRMYKPGLFLVFKVNFCNIWRGNNFPLLKTKIMPLESIKYFGAIS